MAKAKANETAEEAGVLTIPQARMSMMAFLITGTAPLVMHAFRGKAEEEMRAKQEAGSRSKSRKVLRPKDFERQFEDAKHISTDGWLGIPAAGFRSAMISACKMVGFHMTRARLACFVEADGFDGATGDPLVKITRGEPRYFEKHVRLDNGNPDLRARPMWAPGWQAVVRVRWDEDQFSLTDVSNLLSRVGLQVGICEGRPDSKKSAGCGWGLFSVDQIGPAEQAA